MNTDKAKAFFQSQSWYLDGMENQISDWLEYDLFLVLEEYAKLKSDKAYEDGFNDAYKAMQSPRKK